jgi:hypothetical protein
MRIYGSNFVFLNNEGRGIYGFLVLISCEVQDPKIIEVQLRISWLEVICGNSASSRGMAGTWFDLEPYASAKHLRRWP